MITYSETYEYEEKSPKIYPIGNFGVGFAGDLESITFVKDNLRPTKYFSEFIKQFTEIIRRENDRRIGDFVRKHTLLSLEEFKEYVKEDMGKIPPGLVEWIYGGLSDIRLDIETLAVGFEGGKPQIAIIDEDGNPEYVSESFHGAIGSGEMFSEIYFNVGEYSSRCSLYEGLSFAFRAKKSAESHTGVGLDTDILIICRDSDKPILITGESEKMGQLTDIYNAEKKSIRSIYDQTTSKVQTVIDNAK